MISNFFLWRYVVKVCEGRNVRRKLSGKNTDAVILVLPSVELQYGDTFLITTIPIMKLHLAAYIHTGTINELRILIIFDFTTVQICITKRTQAMGRGREFKDKIRRKSCKEKKIYIDATMSVTRKNKIKGKKWGWNRIWKDEREGQKIYVEKRKL